MPISPLAPSRLVRENPACSVFRDARVYGLKTTDIHDSEYPLPSLYPRASFPFSLSCLPICPHRILAHLLQPKEPTHPPVLPHPNPTPTQPNSTQPLSLPANRPQSERDRAEVTARLVATLQELADERAEHAARLAALQSELQTSASSASTSRAAAAATAAEALAEAAVLRGTIEDWAGKAEGLAVAVESWKRRAEVAEKRAAELEFTAEEEAGWEGGHEEGREEGRREAEQR